MQTTMRISSPTRDALARVAEEELGGVSLDEALRIVLFEHQTATALANLDPDEAADYRDEAQGLAGTDTQVQEW